MTTPPLEPRRYTDPAIFAEERAGLLSRTWQMAGHAMNIPNAGDYFTFEIAGEALVAVRDGEGAVKTFYNVCQHRAHQLVRGEGNVRALVCPYHAWTYDLNGQFKGGPNVTAMTDLDASGVCLTPARTEVFCGFIFVNLDPGTAPMADWFPGVEAELREFIPWIDDLAPLVRHSVTEACNWKVSVENYSECYHCTLNHRNFTAGVIDPEIYDIQPQGHCLRHTTRCQSPERMAYGVDPEQPHATDYSSWFLWPMASFQVYPGNILNTYHWRPLDADRVEVVREWYTGDGRDPDLIRQLAQMDRDTTVKEDIRLVESVQRGLNSRGYRPAGLMIDPMGGVNSEHSIAALHAWMREE